MNWYLSKGPEWDVVISSRIRLARDLADYAFPHKLEPSIKEQVRDKVVAALDGVGANKNDHFVTLNMDLLPISDRLSLMEKHLISEKLTKGEMGQSVCISQNESISVLINEEDHIRIQVMDAGFSLGKIYRQAETIAIELEKSLPIAYSDKYGFLTACPSNTGTGMRASVLMHLPGLTEQGRMKDLIVGLGQAGFTVRGYMGEHSQAEGNLYQLSNQITLGISEIDILNGFQRMVREVMSMERGARKEILESNPILLKDKVYRSYGELLYARVMTDQEAKKRISDLRLGISLGIFTEQDEGKMAQLSAAIGTASVEKNFGAELPTQRLDIHRAELIRQLLTQDTDNNGRNPRPIKYD